MTSVILHVFNEISIYHAISTLRQKLKKTVVN